MIPETMQRNNKSRETTGEIFTTNSEIRRGRIAAETFRESVQDIRGTQSERTAGINEDTNGHKYREREDRGINQAREDGKGISDHKRNVGKKKRDKTHLRRPSQRNSRIGGPLVWVQAAVARMRRPEHIAGWMRKSVKYVSKDIPERARPHLGIAPRRWPGLSQTQRVGTKENAIIEPSGVDGGTNRVKDGLTTCPGVEDIA
ncbi:hypothetical protein K438DRAFT_1775465 [Mycena galopus ATCC 62051]|nr:hypothetical protein K438DRAFT_1775465 [Mycena galopus ATCC 62051]